MKNLLLSAIIVTLTSCGAFHKATLEKLENTNYQMSYDAMRRGTVLSINKDGEINTILSEVQPDAAIAKATEITSKIAANLDEKKNVSVDQMTKITETLTKLGERTAQVNMLRDALYRLEEHCVNFKSQCLDERYWNSFDGVVKAITSIKQSEAVEAGNEAVKAEKELKKIQEFKTLSPEDKAIYYKSK